MGVSLQLAELKSLLMKSIQFKIATFVLVFFCFSINAQDKANNHQLEELKIDKTTDSEFDKNYNKGVAHYNAALKFVARSEYDTVDELSELQKQTIDEMKQALPYFEKAYTIDSKNKNVLNALSGCCFALNDKVNYEKYQKELSALGK